MTASNTARSCQNTRQGITPDFAWLQGPKGKRTTRRELVETLCSEMRRVILDPCYAGKATLPQMRKKLTEFVANRSNKHPDGRTLRTSIVRSLDPASIKAHGALGAPRFKPQAWNEIAAHVTEEVLDAYLASGNSIHNLPLFTSVYDPIPWLTPKGLLARLPGADDMVLYRTLLAAEEGHLPAPQALEAADFWLSRCEPPRPLLDQGSPSWNHVFTLMRLLAALKGWRGDDWSPSNDPAAARALELTRSAHGRLKLHALNLDREALVRNPAAEIAHLAAMPQA